LLKEDLLRIEPQSALRRLRPGDPEPGELARLEIRDERAPVVVGAMLSGIERDDFRRLGIILVVEQEQLHQRAVLRVEAEVDALRMDGRADWKAFASSNLPSAHVVFLRGERATPDEPSGSALSTGTGFARQMLSAYSRIERSEEK
jgi:hypothetical protein